MTALLHLGGLVVAWFAVLLVLVFAASSIRLILDRSERRAVEERRARADARREQAEQRARWVVTAYDAALSADEAAEIRRARDLGAALDVLRCRTSWRPQPWRYLL